MAIVMTGGVLRYCPLLHEFKARCITFMLILYTSLLRCKPLTDER